MPGGLLVTVPEPAPNFTTFSVASVPGVTGPGTKLAVQVFSMSSVTLPSAQSESPLQPTNLASGAGVAGKVATLPGGKVLLPGSPPPDPAGAPPSGSRALAPPAHPHG